MDDLAQIVELYIDRAAEPTPTAPAGVGGDRHCPAPQRGYDPMMRPAAPPAAHAARDRRQVAGTACPPRRGGSRRGQGAGRLRSRATPDIPEGGRALVQTGSAGLRLARLPRPVPGRVAVISDWRWTDQSLAGARRSDPLPAAHSGAARDFAVILGGARPLLAGRLSGGYIGVHVFFVISGFLIHRSTLPGTRSHPDRAAGFWGEGAEGQWPASLAPAFSAIATGPSCRCPVLHLDSLRADRPSALHVETGRSPPAPWVTSRRTTP